MSSILKNPSPSLLVEGLKFPVDPIEVLGFSSPLSDEVISVLVSNIRSKSNALQIELVEQLLNETKRARRSEVEARNKTIYFNDNNKQLKEKLSSKINSEIPLEHNLNFSDINSFSDTHIELIKITATWIRARTLAEVEQNGLNKCIHQEDVLTNADITKSSMFNRIRQGKPPLVHIPPTAFGQPWYEILESNLLHRVNVEIPQSLVDKLLQNDPKGVVGEKILINKCEWSINKVVIIGHEYELNWPNTSFVYKLKRSNNLLDSHDGKEQGWTLQKIKS